MAEFSPISENLTPTGPIETVDWNDELTVPATGYVDTDVSGSFQPDRSNEPYTFPSVRGSAISVQDKLANISFVEGSAGEMSASIAYIRYWSRKGTQQKTAVGDNPIDGAVSDPLEQLISDFNSQFQPGVVFNPITESFSEAGQPVIPPPNESALFQTPSRTVLTVPTNTAYQSRPRQPVPTSTTEPRSNGASFLNRLGSIFSANPGGAAAPAWANPFYTPSAAPDPDGAVWQFLFNPEELQLSSGPDYNRAETWGVADPANSGQPLSWRSNKNRKLTFGKVLLHGYTFGKRVDSLENGLQQLFQARDGENGADGPPVLEFVWGQRVFGPCVIQNIQVREKAWDKGLLVNAEVSFELEQVPEWTINDGFVDVLRPGRQSTINDPSLPGRTGTTTETTPSTTNEPPANNPGGGGGQPDITKGELYKKCKNINVIRGNFKSLAGGLTNWNAFWQNIWGFNPSSFFEPKLKQYEDNYNLGVFYFGSSFADRMSGYKPDDVRKRVREKFESALILGRYPQYQDAIAALRVAAQKGEAASKSIFDTPECKSAYANEKKFINKSNRDKLCSIRVGSPCNSSGANLKPEDPFYNKCTKVTLICGRDGKFRAG